MKKADRDILGILTETRTVYTVKVGKRSRSFLTPDGAREGFFRMSAAECDYCECDRGDHVTPSYYCGCKERQATLRRTFEHVMSHKGAECLRRFIIECQEDALDWNRCPTCVEPDRRYSVFPGAICGACGTTYAKEPT